MIGTLLNDRYRLDAELGHGGMDIPLYAAQVEDQLAALETG